MYEVAGAWVSGVWCRRYPGCLVCVAGNAGIFDVLYRRFLGCPMCVDGCLDILCVTLEVPECLMCAAGCLKSDVLCVMLEVLEVPGCLMWGWRYLDV